MEKIKNLLNPGKAKDDETLYGSGTNTGTSGGLAGEGSHLASSTGTASGVAGSQAGTTSGIGSTGTSNIGNSNAEIIPGASTQQGGHGTGNTTVLGHSAGSAGQGSHLSSGAATGLTGNQIPGLGNTSTTTGSGPSPLARGAATTAASTIPGNTGFPQHGNQHGGGHELGSQNITPAVQGQSGTSLGSSNTTGSHMPGSWDDSYEQGSDTGGTNAASGLGSSTRNPLNSSSTQGPSHLGSATGTSGFSQGQNTSHLGRDAVALGTAGAIGEGIHHHRENERGLGSNSANTSSNSGLGSATVFPSTTSHSSQLSSSGATNPAIQSGYGSNGSSNSGLGSATVFPSTTSQPTQLGSASSGNPLNTSTTQSSLPHRTLGSNHPTSTGHDSTHTGNTSSGHHLGRDAAAVGATGLAAESIHHHRENERGLGDNDYSGTSRSMPLSSNTAHNTSSTSHPLGSGTGHGNQSGNANTGYVSQAGHNTSIQHHLGRDAAAVGTAGAVGEGIHHHREHDHDLGSSGATSGSHILGSTTGPYSTNVANLLDPNISGGARAHEDAHTHHPHHGGGAEAADKDHSADGGSNTVSRNSAIGASGIGGAIGVDEFERRHENAGSSGPGHTSGVYQPLSGSTTSRNDPTSTSTTDKDHRYGRDTAVAGGIGGAAYETDRHHKHDKDLTEAERNAKKQHEHNEKELKKQHKHDEKEAHKGSKGGLLGFLHRDKNKKYSAEEEAEFDRQERDHKGGLLGFLHRDKNKKYSAEEEAQFDRQERDHISHKGRDAALGAGAVGTAGYAAHEHNKHQAGTSLADKPVGQDLGDKLHGVDRNRGVPGSSGLPGTAGYGDGSNVHSEASTDQYGKPLGAGVSTGTGNAYMPGPPGAASNVHSEASVDQHGRPIGSGISTGTGNDYLPGHQGQGSHLGRDAAIGTGVGGLATHEAHQHGSGHQQVPTTSYDNQTSGSGLTGSRQGQGQAQHHLGRDAAVLGSAGALGEHEHRKHEGTHQTGSNTVGSTGQYDNTSSTLGQHSGLNKPLDPSNDGRVGPSIFAGSEGRNRLHKDPPADHPAGGVGASHVPGSGNET